LERTGNGGLWRITMPPDEWREIRAMAKFGQAAVAYDRKTAYVAQILEYYFVPLDVCASSPRLAAAFTAVDALGDPGASLADVTLALPKDSMEELLLVLEMVSRAEEKAETHSYDSSGKPLFTYPDLRYQVSRYEALFDELLEALRAGRSADVPPPYPERKY